MQCPNCQQDNPAGSNFCQFCGAEFGKPSQFDIFKTSSTQSANSPPRSQPAQPPPAQAQPTHPPPSPYAHQDQQQWSQAPPVQGQPPASRAQQTSQTGRIGKKGTSTWNIWGPFAGNGQRGRHVSWLLDDLGSRAADLHQAVTRRFQQRQVPDSSMNWEQLIAQGLLVENRPFFIIRRGITMVALYIAEFGKDLYISQVTYVKGAVSNVRILALLLLILYEVFFLLSMASAKEGLLRALNPLSGGGGSEGLGTLLCVIMPLGLLTTLLLLLFFVGSVLTYYAEKDFFALLREAPNEFEYDDMLALEKAVEETVRQALDNIGIDAKLLPPAQEKSRVRLI